MTMLREIMREGFLHVVQSSASVAEAVETMARNNVGIVAVLDGQRLCGVFSERDLLQRVVAWEKDPDRLTVDQVMTRDVVTAEETEDYRSAMRLMDERNIRHLPVTRGDQLVSMLSIRDLMRAEMSRLEYEYRQIHEYVYTVPPEGPPR
jgi:CBS domain-containing protein